MQPIDECSVAEQAGVKVGVKALAHYVDNVTYFRCPNILKEVIAASFVRERFVQVQETPHSSSVRCDDASYGSDFPPILLS